jgi:hypothetical protein
MEQAMAMFYPGYEDEADFEAEWTVHSDSEPFGDFFDAHELLHDEF